MYNCKETEQGPFVGVAYGMSIGEGLLHASAATGYLMYKYKEYDKLTGDQAAQDYWNWLSVVEMPVEITGNSRKANVDSSFGVNLGFGWKSRIPMIEKFIYDLKFAYSYYKYGYKIEDYMFENTVTKSLATVQLAVVYTF